MNILHLHNYLNMTCGITRMINQLIKFGNPKNKYFVAAFGGNSLNNTEGSGLSIFSGTSRTELFCHIQQLSTICKTYDIDIIHSHSRYFDLMTWILPSINKIYSVTTIHSIVHGFVNLSYKSNNLVAVSKAVKNHLITNFHIPSERIVVINNFLSPFLININQGLSVSKIRLNIKNETVISFIGRFSLEKGIDVLLKAIRLLGKMKIQALVILLIGEGKEEKLIREFQKKLNIVIHIIPPTKNVWDYYNISDIIVLPSRVDPFPMVMLESGLMHKALIAGNVDGIKTFIENGESGILVDSEDVEGLAEAIWKLVNDANLREKLGNNLYKKVLENNYSQMHLYEELYNRIGK